jgi:hypothetical protein
MMKRNELNKFVKEIEEKPTSQIENTSAQKLHRFDFMIRI